MFQLKYFKSQARYEKLFQKFFQISKDFFLPLPFNVVPLKCGKVSGSGDEIQI